MLVSAIINASMRKLGLIARGETATTAEYTDGLEALQTMLRFWSTKKINIFAEVTDTLTLVSGTASYTWGSGGNITTTRPNKLERAYVRDSNNEDYPVGVISFAEYDGFSTKTLLDRPEKIAFNGAYPLSYIYLYPTPNAAETLYIVSVKPFTETSSFSATSDTIAMPVTYELPIIYNLAVVLSSEYGVSIPPEVAQIAMNSFDEIQSMNAANYIQGMKLCFPAGEQGRYDIETDR